MANKMYINLSGNDLNVYDPDNISNKIGAINNNEAYVVTGGIINMKIKFYNHNNAFIDGVILSQDITIYNKVSILDHPYVRKEINGENYYIYKARFNCGIYDGGGNYVGTVKSGMFIATDDDVMGNSYPYLKKVSYIMNSSTNSWENFDGYFVDTGLRNGSSDKSIGLYGIWGENIYEPLPEEKTPIYGLYINNSSNSVDVYDVNSIHIGKISEGHLYAVKEKYKSGKCLVRCNIDNKLVDGYIIDYTNEQQRAITDFAFRREIINEKSYYIFQIRRQTNVYDFQGNNWGKVGTYMLVACEDNQCGRSNSNFKAVTYIQRSSDLSWVQVPDELSNPDENFGFVDTGLDISSNPNEIYLYGDWGNNKYIDVTNIDFVPYTIAHIAVPSCGKRTCIPMTPSLLTIHSTATPDSKAWGERNYLELPENTSDVGFHIVVDDFEAVEAIPLNEVAYHCSSTIGNKISIGLEICESGNRTKTLNNAIEVSANILKKYNLSIENLRIHNDWNGKNCPRILIDSEYRESSYQTWNWFVSEVAKKLGQTIPNFNTNTELTTKKRYEYNVNFILNKNPIYFSEGMSINEKNELIYANISELKRNLFSQFTSRQMEALDDVCLKMRNSDENIKTGINEFRYEGAGTYRSGTNLNNDIDSNWVSEASVNFINLNGAHYDNTMLSEWADGYGLYGAISIVYRAGDIVGVFFRASTLPDKIEIQDTVADGTYKFVVGTHPQSGGYKALNLYTLNGSRTLPAIIDKVSGVGVSGVNAHKGYKLYRGSEGCQTIASEDYDNYINLFKTGEEGQFYIKRYVSLPTIK